MVRGWVELMSVTVGCVPQHWAWSHRRRGRVPLPWGQDMGSAKRTHPSICHPSSIMHLGKVQTMLHPHLNTGMPNVIQATCANYRNHTAMHVPHHHSAAFMGVGKAGSACAGDPHRSASGGGRSLGVSQAFPLVGPTWCWYPVKVPLADAARPPQQTPLSVYEPQGPPGSRSSSPSQTILRRYPDDTQTIRRRYPDDTQTIPRRYADDTQTILTRTINLVRQQSSVHRHFIAWLSFLSLYSSRTLRP